MTHDRERPAAQKPAPRGATTATEPRAAASRSGASRSQASRAAAIQAASWKSPTERARLGQDTRKVVPLDAHAEIDPGGGERDPVAILADEDRDRVPELIPIRYGRMLVSPFTFFRGAAALMADDLARTQVSGMQAQLCGDAHLSNFGLFASAERNLVFDINDFDETLAGPWEWDVKRLVASLAVAGRDNGYSAKQRRRIVIAAGAAYRAAMREFAGQSNLAVWYAQLDTGTVLERFRSHVNASQVKRTKSTLAKARTRDSLRALGKLTQVVDGERRIISTPPVVVPVEELMPNQPAERIFAQMQSLLAGYSTSLPPERRHLLAQFRLVHMARKVVGVGSVGTRAWILLLLGRDDGDPLFLQAKEAGASVLEKHLGAGEHAQHGQRVVGGQHLIQASSDIFLGFQRVRGVDGKDRDFYVRQLSDWKGSAVVEGMTPSQLSTYGSLCGWALARAHARSGDRIAIAAYLGSSGRFDEALADFAETYADLNEADYARLETAVSSGQIRVQADT